MMLGVGLEIWNAGSIFLMSHLVIMVSLGPIVLTVRVPELQSRKGNFAFVQLILCTAPWHPRACSCVQCESIFHRPVRVSTGLLASQSQQSQTQSYREQIIQVSRFAYTLHWSTGMQWRSSSTGRTQCHWVEVSSNSYSPRAVGLVCPVG